MTSCTFKSLPRVLVLYIIILVVVNYSSGQDSSRVDHWAVEIEGGNEIADQVAMEMGYENLGPVGNLENTYHFKRESEALSVKKRGGLAKDGMILSKHKRVRWAEQQTQLERTKRDYQAEYMDYEREAGGDEDPRFLNYEDQNNKRWLDRQNVATRKLFNDPYWKDEWYLHDLRVSQNERKRDLHVIPVWLQNITGKGVVVSIIDDGLEKDHPDLVNNYDPKASYDFNDNDHDPQPRYDGNNEHGTRCAGEVSMSANNGICGVGVAFHSKIGGIRVLDGVINDVIEAKALGFNNQHIDIFSASWGPKDNGKMMETPGKLANAALKRGVEKGRGGKGVLYVWASGNGGAKGDTCSCDGYTSSIYTLSFSTVTESFTEAYYAEKCPSTLASTFSSGAVNTQSVVATDLNHKCTTKHSGTSAAAPMAAGVLALVLEANPNLTWRDIKYLITWTSETSPILTATKWQTNKAGYMVSPGFGFGILNADALVKEAKSWVTVPKKYICKVDSGDKRTLYVSSKRSITVAFESTGCKGTSDEVNYLEEVEVVMNMNYTNRGALEIYIISPAGMKTTLLYRRNRDDSLDGIQNWPFTSKHNWGESSRGKWTVEIKDYSRDSRNHGALTSVYINFHGVRDMPHHVKKAPKHRREYNMDYNKVKNSRSNVYDEPEYRNFDEYF